MNGKKLNIGCETDYREGWVNLDFDKNYKADIYWDLNDFPYPFKDNEFKVILACFVLEHVKDFYKTMLELHRISEDKGKILITVPHFSDPTQFAEQDHKTTFSIHAFGERYWNKEIFINFEVMKRRIYFTRVNMKFMNYIINPIVNTFSTIYERLFAYMLPCALINVILRVRKDEEWIVKKKYELHNKEGNRLKRKGNDPIEFIYGNY